MALVPFPKRDEESPQLQTPDPPDSSSPFDEEEALDGRMTFLEHLDELRKRITHAVVALLVGFFAAFAFANRTQEFVYARLTADIPSHKLIYTEPGEGFFIYLKIAALSGLILASPYMMWQVWLFIAPGLYAREKKLAIPFVDRFLVAVRGRRRVLALRAVSRRLEVLRRLLERLHGVHAPDRPGVRRST